MKLWDLFSNDDGSFWYNGGKRGPLQIECTPANVLLVNMAINYGWMSCDDRRLLEERDSDVDDENRKLKCSLKTRRFYKARRCVNKEFLKNKKDELEDFHELIGGNFF